jgi:hypothetical protein
MSIIYTDSPHLHIIERARTKSRYKAAPIKVWKPRCCAHYALRRGMGDIAYAQVHGSFRARLASGEFQTVERLHAPCRQFTTARTIAADREILQRVREGHNQMQPITSTL